jgi:eukaryotic-like serine/threonine-protein kinase
MTEPYADIPEALRTLERYRIEARIGRGGMGEVFRAYDARLGREVALKVVHPSRISGISTDDAHGNDARRLLREAQALAKVSHPNVIAVYDVGTVAKQVFVAMELVDGETLTAWLAREAHSPEAILAVFLAAGEGLVAAHSAGLVHRDFKPENVMVGQEGRVRVLDFGLARATTDLEPMTAKRGPSALIHDGAGTTTINALVQNPTDTGALVGTPRYMAPEQWLGHVPDARSDQYSFCVALHEALFGSHPQLGEASATADAKRAPARYRNRRIERAIARGLSPGPNARHPTMRALLAELRPRVTQWTVAVAALLAAASVGTAWAVQARATSVASCDASPELIAGTWDDARRERLARGFSQTLGKDDDAFFPRFRSSIDRYVDEVQAMHGDACRATRALHTQSPELMDLRMRCLDLRLNGLRGLLSWVEKTEDKKALLGALEDVNKLPPVALCADTEQLARAVPLPGEAATRATILELEGRVAEELESSHRDKSGDKVTLARELEAKADATAYEPLHGRALLLLGIAQAQLGKTADATATLQRSALAAGRGRDDRTVAQAWAELAAVHVSTSAYEKALTLEAVAQVAIARVGGALEIEAPLERSIGWALRELERFEEASARYERIIADLSKDPSRIPVERARALSGLAVVRKEQGRYPEAQKLYEEAIAVASSALGPRHVTVASFKGNLGVTLRRQGQLDEAKALFEEARDIFAAALGPDHPDRGSPLANLGTLFLDTGRLDEAESSYSEALRIWEKAFGEGQLQVAGLRVDLGRLSLKRGRTVEAVARLEAALRSMGASAGADSAHAASARASLAEAYMAIGRAQDARNEVTRALADYRAHGKEPNVLAEIELTAAEVTAGAGGSGAEAFALATAARARAAAAGPDATATVRRADAWLAAHYR